MNLSILAMHIELFVLFSHFLISSLLTEVE